MENQSHGQCPDQCNKNTEFQQWTLFSNRSGQQNNHGQSWKNNMTYGFCNKKDHTTWQCYQLHSFVPMAHTI